MRARLLLAGTAVLAAVVLGNQAVHADPGAPIVPNALLPAGAVAPSAASLAAQRVLEAAADAPLTIIRDTRGLAHTFGTTALHPLPLPAGADASNPQAMARAQLARVAPLFGLTDVARELVLEPKADGLPDRFDGDLIVRFQQLRGGLPVLGGELSVVMDPTGALKSVPGETLPSAAAPAAATVTGAQAQRTALALVQRDHPHTPRTWLHASAPQRWWFDPALIGVPAAEHMLAGPVWRFEVADGGAVRESVLVDSQTDKVPLHWDMINESLAEAVCDGKNQPDKEINGPDCVKTRYVRVTGQAATNNTEVDQSFDNGARTATFYQGYVDTDLTTLLGSDTGDGKKIRSTVRFCPDDDTCALSGGLLSNAFWNGRGMYYGNGWTAGDDVVAHELTHGVTERTSKLLYLYQSGAINESMSDIFGELTDLTDGWDGAGIQTPWVIGEDAPLTQVPLRNMADPTSTLGDPQPDSMTSPYYKADLAFTDNGAVHDNSGVGNKAGYLIAHGAVFNGQTIQGIGYGKTATLYFRVENMLTSGADYQDLGNTLNQACSDLIGHHAFTTSTCAQVRATVLATGMAKQPTTPNAAAPEASQCPTGQTRANILYEGFEGKVSTKRWTLGGQWIQIPDYAEQGKSSVYGVEPDHTTSSSMTLKTPISVPKGKVTTYLRFAHQYRLDAGLFNGPYYDGVRVEYRLSGHSTWHTLSGKSWQNGPTNTITPQGGSTYTGWGGDSHGYMSSKVNINFLAGKKAYFRWRIFGDKQTAVDGWTVDDIRWFTCGTSTPSSVSAASASAGKQAIRVAWSEPYYPTPTGITKYRIHQSSAGTRTRGAKVRSTTFHGLKKGKKYTFTVTPYAAGGAGPHVTRSAIPK
jgi:Zn-dependent metalloprotease